MVKFWLLIGLKYGLFKKKFMKLSLMEKNKFIWKYYDKLNKLQTIICKHKLCKNINTRDYCVYVIEELGRHKYNEILKSPSKLPYKKSKMTKNLVFYMY